MTHGEDRWTSPQRQETGHDSSDSFIALGLVFVATGMTTVPAAGAPAACDPFLTEPTYDGTTPTDEQVLGFALGSQEVSVRQSGAFLSAVDSASDRVVTDTAAVSVGGRPLRYAIVGLPDRVTSQALADIRAGAAALRDPLLPASEVNELVAKYPPSCGWLPTCTAMRRVAQTPH